MHLGAQLDTHVGTANLVDIGERGTNKAQNGNVWIYDNSWEYNEIMPEQEGWRENRRQ